MTTSSIPKPDSGSWPTAEKGHITGYGVEGWHFRYVGVDVATEMYLNNISTLEEYYGKPQIMPDDYNE